MFVIVVSVSALTSLLDLFVLEICSS